MAADGGMLLLERAVPGTSLKIYFPDKEPEAVEIACKAMKKLHQANIPKTRNSPYVKDWLSALDKEWDLPSGYLQKARKLCDQLLQHSGPDVLLHGDFCITINILQNGEDRAVIGESTYEVAAFI